MKGIGKVFAVAAALAVVGLVLMLAGFVFGGPSAARQAMNYTNLTQRHYQGYVPGWLERALGWEDDIENWADDFEDGMDRWADGFEDGMNDWADDFEDDMEDRAEDVEDWANGYQGGHHAGQGMAWGPGVCIY